MDGTGRLGTVDVATGTVDLRVSLTAAPDAVWCALTDPGHTPARLGRLVGGPPVTGARLEVWHEDDVRSTHEVLRCDPARLLELTWDSPGEPVSRVAVELDGATRLRVLHEDLADPVPYAAGWHRHLQYLDAHLRGGDLPAERFQDGHDDLVDRYRPRWARRRDDRPRGTTTRR